MRKTLLCTYFCICWCQLAFGRSDMTDSMRMGASFLPVKTEVDTCNSPAFRIERTGDVLKIAGSVLAENDFTYQWYKNGEAIPNATGKTWQTKEAGYYTLKLTTKTSPACVKTSANFISIYAPASDTSLILFVDYRANKLTTIPTIAGSSLEWYRDNQLLVGETSNAIDYQATGTYQVKERYQNITRESNELVLNTGVAIEIVKETYLQLGDPCRPGPYLKTNFLSDIPVQYQWYLNGNPVKDSTNSHFNPITIGEYQVSVYIPSRNRTYVSGKYKLLPIDFPKSLPISVEEACSGNALLKVNDAFMQKYQFQSIIWRLDGQEIPNEIYPYYRATKSGYYTFSVKYLVNAQTQECTYNSFIEYTKKTDSDLNVGYAYAGSGCVVDSFKIFVDYNKSYTYSWMKNDTLLKNQTTHELFIRDKSIYKSFINKGNGCINETNPITLKGCTPDESGQFLLLNPPVVTADKTTVFVNEQSYIRANGCSNVSFQWLKDTEPIVGANKAEFEIKQSGTYRLQIEKSGCKAVSEPVRIVVENLLSEEPDIDLQVKVFPNPFNESVIIELPTSVGKETEVKLTDVTGKLVKNQKVDSKHSLELSNLPDGVYLLSFYIGEKRVVKKIVKRH
ncbi:T9SS type A sorting domain-containing protein [Emticicia agri]|nr:T9SS type A sorting domain-containing protein [Emticicia agri]